MATYPLNLKGPKLCFTRKNYKTASTDSSNPKKTYSLNVDTSIHLYIPGGIQDSMTASWGPESVIPGFSLKGSDQGGLTDALTQAGIQQVRTGLTTIAGKAAGENFAATVASQTGKAVIPNQMLLYGGPDFSSISLNFEMVPRSENEADNIAQIVKFFRDTIYANVDINGTDAIIGLDYPPVFDIKILGGSKTVSGIANYSDMALTNCSISYGQGGSSTTFFMNGNAPVNTNMQLSFKRIKLFSQDSGSVAKPKENKK